ncbi:PE family protein [Mycobacterium tuberculosis]|nr:PE family protein [Mycobacterium tuberculosis]
MKRLIALGIFLIVGIELLALILHDRRLPPPRGGGPPPPADEVSALTAAQFAAHAQIYQAVSAQAAAIHEMFVNTLQMSSGSYAATEAANAAAAG